MENLWSTVVSWAANVGLKIVIAVVLFAVSFKVINVVLKKLEAELSERANFDRTLTKTLIYAANVSLKVVIAICLVGYLGIETSGLSALVASLGVCAGLAVNGTLSNLAGGVMILVTRPFRLGDYISAQGSEGTVEEIHICHTKIITVDNKVIYLPNSGLSTGTIVNYSEKPDRRVDLDFSVAGNDPEKVRRLLLEACAKEALVYQNPEPFARVTDFGAGNGLKITLRAWCKSENYWDVYLNLLDSVRKSFEANGITVPFNQLDVHVKTQ